MTQTADRRLSIWEYANPTPAPTPRETRTRPNIALAEKTAFSPDAVHPFDPEKPTPIVLDGRRILSNGTSQVCKTKTISKHSVDLYCEQPISVLSLPEETEPLTGHRISIDLDKIGRFKGIVTADTEDGIILAVDEDFKAHIESKLTELMVPVRTKRIEPENRVCMFSLASGEQHKAKLINISTRDALLRCGTLPDLGALLTFAGTGKYTAEVTRTFEIGFEVRFNPPIPDDQLSVKIKLIDA